MRYEYRTSVFVMPSLVLLCGLTLVARAEVSISPEELTQFRARAAAVAALDSSLRMRIEADMAHDGAPVQSVSMEAFIADRDHLRVDVSDRSSIVVTPNRVVGYHGPSGACLLIPQETLTVFGEARDRELAHAGFGASSILLSALDAVAQSVDRATVIGETRVDEVECLVFEVAPEDLAAWDYVASGDGAANATVARVEMTLERETGALRGAHTEASVSWAGGAPVAAVGDCRLPEVELGADLSDALSVEVPDGAFIMRWLPDATAPQMAADVGRVIGALLRGSAEVGRLMSGFTNWLGRPVNSYVRVHQTTTVDGQTRGEEISDIWLRDMDHWRMERDGNGTTITSTPSEVTIYSALQGTGLRIPQATLEALGTQRYSAMRDIGMGTPASVLNTLALCLPDLAITGEETVGDVECWVLDLGPAALPRVDAVTNGMPEGSRAVAAQVVVEKDAGTFRGLYLSIEGPAAIELELTMPQIETNVAVTDDMLAVEPPEGVTLVEWTPDMSVADAVVIAERMRGGG